MTLDGWLQTCQTDDRSAVTISKLLGRDGNHLHQISNAYMVAQASGRKYVKLPAFKDSVYDFHSILTVTPRRGRWGAGCQFVSSRTRGAWPCGVCPHCCVQEHDCKYVFLSYCESSVMERREVYVEELRHYICPQVHAACNQSDKNTVVMHIRNGDACCEWTGTHAQPPCLYYHEVINRGKHGGPFSTIRLVYQAGLPKHRTNACLADITSKHENKVEKKHTRSLMVDACTILKAESVALPPSSFSITLAMMSTTVKQVFIFDNTRHMHLSPAAVRNRAHFWELNVSQLCATFRNVAAFSLDMDIRNVTSMHDKIAYFVSFPKKSLTNDTCFLPSLAS